MKKLSALLVSVLFTVVAVQAQDVFTLNEDGAEMTFDSKVLDYGTIEHNADGNREFVFKNTGKEDLIIEACKGSCGCTVPQCPKQPFAPGEEGSIKVKYATNRIGAFEKQVRVTTSASADPIVLTIKGVVKQPPASETEGAEGAEDGK